MKKLMRQFRYGEKGFTLIELLVVIAILGVLAAVVVPNVGKFMGSGTVEAASTEAHNVQTAVMAYMVDNSLSALPDATPAAPTGTAGTIGPSADIGPAVADGTTVKSFITGVLQATYTINTEGTIASAIPTDGGKWSDLTYTPGTGWQKS